MFCDWLEILLILLVLKFRSGRIECVDLLWRETRWAWLSPTYIGNTNWVHRGKPFEEATLWRFFKCLVDGFSVLQEGDEFRYDPVTQTANIRPEPDWHHIVHFDIKPGNSKYYFIETFGLGWLGVVMVGGIYLSHTDVPILKVNRTILFRELKCWSKCFWGWRFWFGEEDASTRW